MWTREPGSPILEAASTSGKTGASPFGRLESRPQRTDTERDVWPARSCDLMRRNAPVAYNQAAPARLGLSAGVSAGRACRLTTRVQAKASWPGELAGRRVVEAVRPAGPIQPARLLIAINLSLALSLGLARGPTRPQLHGKVCPLTRTREPLAASGRPV